MPVVNWDSKAKSDSELCGLFEELAAAPSK